MLEPFGWLVYQVRQDGAIDYLRIFTEILPFLFFLI